MTDSIIAMLRAAQADNCCNDIMCEEAADHIDAQDAKIKALVEALVRIEDLTSHNMPMSAKDEQCVNREARAALAAAKETT